MNNEQDLIKNLLKNRYFKQPITAEQAADIEKKLYPQKVQEVVDSVREGIRTVTDLREHGCPLCLAALRDLGEAI